MPFSVCVTSHCILKYIQKETEALPGKELAHLKQAEKQGLAGTGRQE